MKHLIVFGLGYVGLPLALALAKTRKVVGYDNNKEKIDSYNLGIDLSGECDLKQFIEVKKNIIFTNDIEHLHNSKIVIVTVPTPVDSSNVPDLLPLRYACEIIGGTLLTGDLVIFESTVYPGATEEFCIPILEKKSKLKHKQDFNVGYSPERINPGDKDRGMGDVVKVISGDTKNSLDQIESIYAPIIHAGLHRAESIKVAEAAKVIENTQRDVNIALMNELSVICDKLEINTLDVIDAAKTKWNFLSFMPGLVGGHCIGVDPYYLTHKAQQLGYHPDIILAGRRINDSMPSLVAEKLVKKLLVNKLSKGPKSVLIMGMTFKENVKDIRNSKSFDLKKSLENYGLDVETWDPVVDKSDLITYIKEQPEKKYDAIVLAVPHDQFVSMFNHVEAELLTESGIVMDIKGVWRSKFKARLGEKYFTL